MPPHLRTLSREVPYSNPAVIGMLKDNLHKKVNVALIPIEDSIPEDQQVHYDWIGGARAGCLGAGRSAHHDARAACSHQVVHQQGQAALPLGQRGSSDQGPHCQGAQGHGFFQAGSLSSPPGVLLERQVAQRAP